jgi:catechol 2,3-dioxygenase-like lactoylglutathione lyase family enzyme
MLRKPMPVLSALAGLLLPVCLAQQPASTAANAASAKEGAAVMSERGRILGIGGIFFKSANQQQMREWYGKHLGLADKGQGVMMPWREKDNPEKEHVTVWSVFPGNTKYFEPSQAAFMVNYIVDDLDALLERLQKEGVKIDPKRQNEDYGRFAWIYDPDGNKIELWQPLTPKKK